MSDKKPNFTGVRAVLLFGSRARGDNERNSDTDILLIAPPGRPQHCSFGQLSMFFYPWSKLLADASNGELFVCHLTREAKPIYDPEGRLDRLRASFKLRTSYSHDINRASDLGWFLERHADALAAAVVARRIVWCVRTILIARTAERGVPVFSPTELAETTSSNPGREILLARHQHRADAPMRCHFSQFLTEEGCLPPLAREADPTDYKDYFRRTKNEVAISTITQGRKSSEQHYG
ncbi:nucleotidyltransferase domain-containing protein [Acidisoma cellulosilytica]|uniref:Nucleotidyltransferase domain-containing protein n=1 Tax=Acidisoma cellulosilyticum TaxID=2802395 RepID=A0A963Z722_9PROT|nr:nucleotidyltransferase domain-containing protein [Acidisoma cellulosilyticum]MCB8884017.1 nucleotidyltransferase domain-containing protein [Acidisoma cellulosilyticum]